MRNRERLVTIAWGVTIFALWLSIYGVGWTQETPKPEDSLYLDTYKGAGAERIGSEQCILCHSDRAPKSLISHVSLIDRDKENPDYGYGCEACHGPGGAHNGDVAGIIQPAKLEIDDAVKLCSRCHSDLRSFNSQEWNLSEHSYADLSCLACHSGHSEYKYFLVKDEKIEVCFQCHTEKRAELNMRSHHPVEEGQISCVSCHNPHSGKFERQLRDETDKLCFECHGDKEGPFAYDHDVDQASGGEGCLTCHFVHGSNTDNLIRYPQRLCLECHSEMGRGNHFPGTCWASGCHSEIHGSYSNSLFLK